MDLQQLYAAGVQQLLCLLVGSLVGAGSVLQTLTCVANQLSDQVTEHSDLV